MLSLLMLMIERLNINRFISIEERLRGEVINEAFGAKNLEYVAAPSPSLFWPLIPGSLNAGHIAKVGVRISRHRSGGAG